MDRLQRVVGPVALVVAGLLACLAALAFGGAATPLALGDPGPVVRWGLPLVKMIVDLSAAGMIGALVLTVFALAPGKPESERGLDLAAGCAAVMTVASGIVTVLSFLDTAGVGYSATQQFSDELIQFVTQIALGQAWLITTLCAAAVTVLCFAVRNLSWLVTVTLIAIGSLVPIALQGHAAGTDGHNLAITSLGLHIVAATVWIGGLLSLIVIKPALDRSRERQAGSGQKQLSSTEGGAAPGEATGETIGEASKLAAASATATATIVHSSHMSPTGGKTIVSTAKAGEPDENRLAVVLARYSTIALICFIVVAVSGWFNAELRIGTWESVFTPYGGLVVAKAVLLIVLGFFGVFQRRFLIRRIQSGQSKRFFWWMICAELVFMGFATGVAAALARTAPPVAQVLATNPSPAEILTGQPLPPPESWQQLVFGLNIDPIWLLVCVFALYFYLAGVVRLHRRGDKWHMARTISWCCGILVLMYVTNGGINIYEEYLFSAHMLIHMVLTMLVPILLVPGAPISLAMRAINKREDGSRGMREWIYLFVHSGYARVITNPIVSAVVFAASLWVFYYSPLFRWATENHIGHEWMIVHFLMSGYLFVQSLIGIDPVHYRPPHPLRLILLLGTMVLHAFFGLAILESQGLFLANWFGAMGRTWGDTPMQDQQLAGGIAWSIGEIPTLALAIVVAVQWSRSDEKETRRSDRASDRSGGADIEEYNAMLARLAQRDTRDSHRQIATDGRITAVLDETATELESAGTGVSGRFLPDGDDKQSGHDSQSDQQGGPER